MKPNKKCLLRLSLLQGQGLTMHNIFSSCLSNRSFDSYFVETMPNQLMGDCPQYLRKIYYVAQSAIFTKFSSKSGRR